MFYQTNLIFNGDLKSRSTTKYIILHHSGVATPHTVKDIHQWHKNRGWAGIGYHYFIDKEGNIFEGRPHDTIGAHAKGCNENSIGVCFEGDFNKEKMKEAQLNEEVIRFLFFLHLSYPDSEIVFCDELGKGQTTPINGFLKNKFSERYDAFCDGFNAEQNRVWGEEWAQPFYDWIDEQLSDFGLFKSNEDLD